MYMYVRTNIQTHTCMFVYTQTYTQWFRYKIRVITHCRKIGAAYFYPKGSEKLDKIVTNMHKCNLPVSMLDAKDVYPYLKLPDNFMAAVEEEGGILAASKAVGVLQVWEYDIVPMISLSYWMEVIQPTCWYWL